MHLRPYQLSDRAAVISLWQRCELTRPWNDASLDIARKQRVQPEWFVVVELETGELVGSAMIGYDGHRGWVNYLAVDPDHAGRGIGRRLMQHAEQVLRDAGCPKLNLQVREENRSALAFYRRLGYEFDAVVSLGKRLIADE